ncbi:MAG: penicillin-binding protein 2 [Gammaproteobacteria bacterium]|nr:penicillin-binding protein 2 [Gammaproteobacteria bacterium]
MSEYLAFKDSKSETRIYFERGVFLFASFIIFILVILARYFYLQVIEHDVYEMMSEKNRLQTQPLSPVRGLIYDINGMLIADNKPDHALVITKERVSDMDATLQHLKSLIPISEEQITTFKRRLQRRSRPFEAVTIRTRMTEEEIAIISVNQFVLAGVEIKARLVRNYPKGDLIAHALGSVRRINESDLRRLDKATYSAIDHVGKLGVEKFYEDQLVGKVGYQRVETNALGRKLKVIDAETTPPVPGTNLTLYLDTGLQQAASDALGDRRGAIVAIDPKTGGVMALVSKPSYDPNPFVTGIDEASYARLRDSLDVPLFNRALQGQYEPGSTIKPFLGLVALHRRVVDAGYTIEDPGWFKLPDEDRLYRDWNWTKTGQGGHGKVNFRKAIYRSCNIYFYELAGKLGIDHIHNGLMHFGFGQYLAVDLPEASKGLVPSREWKEKYRQQVWFPGDTVNIGIGQGDMLVTPFQLALATTILANRGKWVQPRMLKSGLVSSEEQDRRDGHQLAIEQEHYNTVISAMEMVVNRDTDWDTGTAWAYIGRDIPYRMAGKSGTAQVVGIAQGEVYDEEELDERNRKHAWFIAFAPVENPQIAVAVLVENGGGGSAIAAPVARQVVDHHLLKNGEERFVVRVADR